MSKRSSDSEDSDPKQLAVRQNVQFGKFGDFADEFEPDIVILFHDLKEAAAKVMYVQEKSLSLQLFAEFLFDALHAPGEIVADDEELTPGQTFSLSRRITPLYIPRAPLKSGLSLPLPESQPSKIALTAWRSPKAFRPSGV